jgi:hypothetical protein
MLPAHKANNIVGPRMVYLLHGVNDSLAVKRYPPALYGVA